MNNPLTAEFTRGLVFELRDYVVLCEKILALATEENLALAGETNYESAGFHERRQGILPGLEMLLVKLRHRRLAWQQISPADRERCEEVKPLFSTIQNLLMKVLLLDRENQQAMLRRGLVPAKHLSTAAVSAQKPNYVASLYARNVPVGR